MQAASALHSWQVRFTKAGGSGASRMHSTRARVAAASHAPHVRARLQANLLETIFYQLLRMLMAYCLLQTSNRMTRRNKLHGTSTINGRWIIGYDYAWSCPTSDNCFP